MGHKKGWDGGWWKPRGAAALICRSPSILRAAAAWTTLTWLVARIAPLLCVCVRCVLSQTQAGVQMRLRPCEQREPQHRSPMGVQQSQNEGEDNEPVRCASDILEHAQKDKSGNWSAEKDPERSLRGRKRKIKPSCPVMAHKGHITGGAQWGTVSLSEMEEMRPKPAWSEYKYAHSHDKQYPHLNACERVPVYRCRTI